MSLGDVAKTAVPVLLGQLDRTSEAMEIGALAEAVVRLSDDSAIVSNRLVRLLDLKNPIYSFEKMISLQNSPQLSITMITSPKTGSKAINVRPSFMVKITFKD